MRLSHELVDYVHAAYTGLWIHTHEPDEAEREIITLARERKWKLAVWDVANGLRVPGSDESKDIGADDPLAALRALPAFGDTKGSALLVLHNFHKFLSNPEVMQTTFAQVVAGKRNRTFIVVLSPPGANSG